MAHTNESEVSEFVLLGLSNSWELQLFFFAIFSFPEPAAAAEAVFLVVCDPSMNEL